MAGSPKEKEVVRINCLECAGGLKNHEVLLEHVESEEDDENYGVVFGTNYQICKCQGCNAIRFRLAHWCSENRDGRSGEVHEHVRVFPEAEFGKRKPITEFQSLPHIGRIYKETLQALNVGALILCGGGLRATVEAICIEQEAAGNRLLDKIDDLVSKGLLVKTQAELLHEERYIGNSALHEIDPPSIRHLELGLDIVEGLLNTIYVLPKKAAELRASRIGKKTGST